MSEWISVEERLPEESVRGDNPYQIAGADGSLFTAFYVDGEWCFGEYSFEDITHWMKLKHPLEIPADTD